MRILYACQSRTSIQILDNLRKATYDRSNPTSCPNSSSSVIHSHPKAGTSADRSLVFNRFGPSSVWSPQLIPSVFKSRFQASFFQFVVKEQSLLLSFALVGQAYIDFEHAKLGTVRGDIFVNLKLQAIRSLR